MQEGVCTRFLETVYSSLLLFNYCSGKFVLLATRPYRWPTVFLSQSVQSFPRPEYPMTRAKETCLTVSIKATWQASTDVVWCGLTDVLCQQTRFQSVHTVVLALSVLWAYFGTVDSCKFWVFCASRLPIQKGTELLFNVVVSVREGFSIQSHRASGSVLKVPSKSALCSCSPLCVLLFVAERYCCSFWLWYQLSVPTFCGLEELSGCSETEREKKNSQTDQLLALV